MKKMNIYEASNFFKSLIIETNKKSEIKIYEAFLLLLTDLKNRNLTKNQLQSIEGKLEVLELKSNPENKKRYFKKKLTEFEKYLKDKFSLIAEGYYTAIGLSLGISFGIVFGTFFAKTIGVSIGVGLGILIGLMVGKSLDTQTAKQNLVLKRN